MDSKTLLKSIIEKQIADILQEEEVKSKLPAIASFEEDPVNFILQKYPSLKETLIMLLTDGYKDYITGIYVIAPKPTTFKIVLHNGQFFYLTYLGRAYEAEVVARRYYLMTVGDKQRAITSIANLLKLGEPINAEGPEKESTAGEGTEETSTEETLPTEEAPEEEKTES